MVCGVQEHRFHSTINSHLPTYPSLMFNASACVPTYDCPRCYSQGSFNTTKLFWKSFVFIFSLCSFFVFLFYSNSFSIARTVNVNLMPAKKYMMQRENIKLELVLRKSDLALTITMERTNEECNLNLSDVIKKILTEELLITG